ncbi:Sensor histidine kinase YehU [Clostridium sp. C105KSO13]|nr:Sensor histidine kinase YehU [Clostridium sp. C105KSO13]
MIVLYNDYMETIKRKFRKIVGRKYPLKWNMIMMLVVGWLLPLTLASYVMFFYISDKIKAHLEENISVSAEKAVQICEMNFSDAVGASRNASYLNVIRDAYTEYKAGGESIGQRKRQLYNTVTDFLNDQYRYNTSFLTTMVYFNSDPDEIYYTYSNIKSGTFDRVQYFENEVLDKVHEESKSLDTDIIFLNVDGNIYMVRNMMTTGFRPFAVIIMELDPSAMFKSFESIMGYQGYEVYLDGQQVADTNLEEPGGIRHYYVLNGMKDHRVYNIGQKNTYVYNKIRFEGHDMDFMLSLDTRSVMNEQNFTYIIGIFLVSMIPLILLVIWFFHREVTRPVAELVDASREIEKGNLGFAMPQVGSSRELVYLGESFNQMSAELKHQFDTIYSEELALRDAKIKALQSQINPHFLNNTLEIINWEARMNGNYKASGMIEALSTMLEATLNRKKNSYIPLSEELSYMDAYLYIIARRFEDKLEIHKNINNDLLQVKVPRLIIQPIVENAVEHGVDEQNRIIIHINIRLGDEDKLIIEIKNHGVLSIDDIKKIEYLLGGGIEREEKSLNIGIRNVNQRLKIIYGPDCGLNIQTNAEGYTVSTLTLFRQM